ncbi:hypothetical protein [Actinoplanes sp. NPDC049265]|uniref:hypothetical protein n=1 Tax=Actinoplanes sp. NPDC049265 TaxID=3363902 RepID=UPI00371EC877
MAALLVAPVVPPSRNAVLGEVRRAEDTESALRAWGANFGALGVYRRPGGNRFVVRVSNERLAAATDANASLRWGNGVEIEGARASRAAVEATATYLRRRVGLRGEWTFAFYYDVQRDVTVLTSDAPGQYVDVLLTGVASPVEFRRGRYQEQWGDGVAGGVSFANVATHRTCTAGVLVVRDGARRILTAGHCGMLGDLVLLDQRYGGRIAERVPFGDRDAALIDCSCGADLESALTRGPVAGVTRFFVAQDVHTSGPISGEDGGPPHRLRRRDRLRRPVPERPARLPRWRSLGRRRLRHADLPP